MSRLHTLIIGLLLVLGASAVRVKSSAANVYDMPLAYCAAEETIVPESESRGHQEFITPYVREEEEGGEGTREETHSEADTTEIPEGVIVSYPEIEMRAEAENEATEETVIEAEAHAEAEIRVIEEAVENVIAEAEAQIEEIAETETKTREEEIEAEAEIAAIEETVAEIIAEAETEIEAIEETVTEVELEAETEHETNTANQTDIEGYGPLVEMNPECETFVVTTDQNGETSYSTAEVLVEPVAEIPETLIEPAAETTQTEGDLAVVQSEGELYVFEVVEVINNAQGQSDVVVTAENGETDIVPAELMSESYESSEILGTDNIGETDDVESQIQEIERAMEEFVAEAEEEIATIEAEARIEIEIIEENVVEFLAEAEREIVQLETEY